MEHSNTQTERIVCSRFGILLNSLHLETVCLVAYYIDQKYNFHKTMEPDLLKVRADALNLHPFLLLPATIYITINIPNSVWCSLLD